MWYMSTTNKGWWINKVCHGGNPNPTDSLWGRLSMVKNIAQGWITSYSVQEHYWLWLDTTEWYAISFIFFSFILFFYHHFFYYYSFLSQFYIYPLFFFILFFFWSLLFFLWHTLLKIQYMEFEYIRGYTLYDIHKRTSGTHSKSSGWIKLLDLSKVSVSKSWVINPLGPQGNWDFSWHMNPRISLNT